MKQEELQEILDAHKKWINNEDGGVRADLRRADLRGANLSGADLRRADLRGADLDFSCWPLWCGGLVVKVCKRIAVQLAYHFCKLDCDDPEYIAARNAILDFANQFHRIGDCSDWLDHPNKQFITIEIMLTIIAKTEIIVDILDFF